MATESPIRISETGGKWPSVKEATTFASSSGTLSKEDLGLLFKGHRIHRTGRDAGPNRSGSAPPSMEGSFLAIENLLSQHNSSTDASLETLNRAMQNCESEEQLRADPAYLAYYCSNVNMNPRLPPPLISWENRRLVRHISSINNNWGLSSVDDSDKMMLHNSRVTLATHKEESEDDHSPPQPYSDQVNKRSSIWHGQDASSLGGAQKNGVDLIQEDFPRTPSPVYNKPVSFNPGVADETADQDDASNSSHEPVVTAASAAKSTFSADDINLKIDLPTSSVPSSSSLDCTGSVALNNPEVTIVESQFKALNIINLPNSENQRNEEKRHHGIQNNTLQAQIPLLIPQGTNPAHVGMDQFLHTSSKFSADVYPELQSSGFTPPLFATAAAYMTPANPFYTNMQGTSLYPPQYVGGYTFNPAAIPPYIAAYSHGAVPFIDGTMGSGFGAQTSGVSSGASVSHGMDMLHTQKFYGQYGFQFQPSFGDPIYMQCHQQPPVEGYGTTGQFDPLVSRGSAGSQGGAFNSQKVPNSGSYLEEQKFQYQRSGGQINVNPRRGGQMAPQYFGQVANMGFLMQYPSSPLPSPVLPGSPKGGPGHAGVRHELRLNSGSARNGGLITGWQGQRGFASTNDPKIVNFLEELKSGKGRKFELSDIIGHIVEFSADQHGSRFIQQKLESCGVEEKAVVFKEVLPHASKLMIDVFGNYVIQKFFEYGSPEQRKELANALIGQILPLSLQMYGCRVIQKALEVIELEQKAQLVRELDGHVMRCVRDQNGNHVIQKCIESIPTEKIGFIISSFRSHVAALSMHPYGCRVIQRVLERCTDELQCQFIVDEILESVCSLVQDQYGNYVTQHVLERGKQHERSQIIGKLSGHIIQLSQHKFASNVVEKCLQYGDATERDLLIDEIIGQNEGSDNLLTMMKDQFGNYVVQKILEICSENQQAVLLSRIRSHAHALKKYTYGKHIVSRLEQLLGEENHTPVS